MKTILIAEDDQAIIEIVKIILEGEGYLIITATHEDAIFEAITKNAPKLILLDIHLDGLDGGELARQLKLKEETRTLPIVMMSANNETERIAKASGADGFLLKPFSIEELLAIVHKYTDQG